MRAKRRPAPMRWSPPELRGLVTTMTDPDPRVSGKGLAILREAGVDVSTGVLEGEAAIAHGGHIARVTKGRPWITLKLAISADE